MDQDGPGSTSHSTMVSQPPPPPPPPTLSIHPFPSICFHLDCRTFSFVFFGPSSFHPYVSIRPPLVFPSVRFHLDCRTFSFVFFGPSSFHPSITILSCITSALTITLLAILLLYIL